jgi:antitoxin component YwqK of YwqJK toxin-antitoxin module
MFPGILKLFGFTALALASLNAFPQARTDTVWNRTDERGLKQGYWKKYYPNERIMYRGYFINDRPAGKMTRYYDDGKLLAELIFLQDSDAAYATMYFKNGQAGAVGKYIGQKRDSTWTYYSYYTGTLSYIETYSMGLKEGVSIKYFSEGAIAEKLWWKDDMKHGRWLQFFEDSTLRLSSGYEMNELHGPYRVYNRKGILKIEGIYKTGKMDGEWKFYDNDGNLQRMLRYKEGELLNKEVREEWAREFMENVEKDLGKIPEPDFDNFFERNP